MTETTWDYRIQDFSPLIVYSSSRGRGSSLQQSNLDASWQQHCPVEPSGPLNNFLCNAASVHTTTVSGATVSLTFHGQSVRLFGNVTDGMEYDVDIDGSTSSGNPSAATQLLASISGLAQGDHTVSLIAKPSSRGRGSGGTLLFEGALVTVGTGLTGANVTRTVVQDSDPTLTYLAFWDTQLFDTWNIPHSATNSTWRQLSFSTSGSVTLPFSGHAIMAYGLSWSFYPTLYRMSIDGQSPVLYYSSSTLPESVPGLVYTSGLLFFQGNLSGTSNTLTFDNDNGIGQIGLDYIEIIRVTGGSPLAQTTSTSSPAPPSTTSPSPDVSTSPISSSRQSHPAVGVIVGVVVGVVIIILFIAFFLYRWRHGRKTEQQIIPFQQASSTAGSASKMAVSYSPNPLKTGSTSASGRRDPKSRGPSTTASPETPSWSAGPVGERGYTTEQSSSPSATGSTGNSPPAINEPSSAAEIQALRRDVQQLMQLVSRPGGSDIDEFPPEYIR